MGSQLYDYRHVHAHNFFLTCPKSTICPIFTQEFCVVFYNFQRNAHECLPQETGNCEILLKHNVAPQDILWRQGQCVKIVNQKRSIIVIFVITYFPISCDLIILYVWSISSQWKHFVRHGDLG